MAQDGKKGGFFGAFKKQAAVPAPPAQSRAAVTTENRSPAVPAPQPKPAPAPKPVAPPAATETGVDTLAAINLYARALVELNASHLKIIELVMTTLTNSINKIAEGTKPKA